jgi:hypothetical protein
MDAEVCRSTQEVPNMKSILRTTTSFVAAAVLAAVVAAPVSAETAWGPRGGMSFNPDQIALGAHVALPIATSFYFVPNADFAFGDDATTFSLNGDAHYRFATDSSIKPYLGAGVSWFNYSPDDFDSFSEAGMNIHGGIWLNTNGSTPFFIEGKFFLSDELPDFKAMIGVNL